MLIHERKLCDVLPKNMSNLFPLDHKYISIFLNLLPKNVCNFFPLDHKHIYLHFPQLQNIYKR